MRSSKKLFYGRLAFAAVATAAAAGAWAQSPTEVRTRDGRIFYADTIQALDNKVLIKPHGLGPVEISIADLQCVGSACGPAAAKPSAAALQSPPRDARPADGPIGIQGSNTIGATLMPAILRKYAESLPHGSAEVSFSPVPEEQTIAIARGGIPVATINLASHGSGTSFEGLLAGTAVIGASSRAIKPPEREALAQKYGVDMLSDQSEHIIALDGLAVIVNRANPVRSLGFSIGMIARIFAGEIADWSQLGGRPGPIAIHARDDKSGTYSTFDDLVLKASKKVLSPAAKRYESSEALTDAVEADPNTIGFIGLPYIRNAHALSVSYACGVGHAPSRYTVRTGVYPLSRRLYLYTLGAPADPVARDIVEFAKSDAAQAAVVEAGFIDQSIELEDPQLEAKWLETAVTGSDPRTPKPAIASFVEEMRHAKRTSVNFRFGKGGFELDAKARLDVRRVARFLQSKEMAGKTWGLVGFADATGDYLSNLALSERRAAAVGNILRGLGVRVEKANILARGWIAPIACNSDEQGRALNRRVELWIGE